MGIEWMHRKYENSWWWRHSHVCWARKLKFSKNTQSMVTQQTIPKVTEVPLQRFIQHLATKITQQTAKWLHSNNTNGCWAVETNVTEEPCCKWHIKQTYVYSQTQCLLEPCRKWSCKKNVFTCNHYVCLDLAVSGIVVNKFMFTWKHNVCSGTGAFGYV